MKIVSFFLAFLLTASNHHQFTTAAAEECVVGEQMLADGVMFRQYVDDGTVMIELETTAQSWLAVGFGTQMVGSTAVVGLPSDGTVSFYTLTSYSGINPMDSLNSNLQDAEVLQTDSGTTLRFKMPTTVGDINIEEGATVDMIYAYSDTNTLGYHGFATRGVFQATFSACKPELNCDLRGEVQLKDGLSVRQIIDQENETLTVQMTYQGQAWLGFGFSNTMLGAEAVIGIPGDTTSLHQLGGYTLGDVVPSAMERQDVLLETDCQQTDTETILTFTRPLMDNGVALVSPGEPVDIIFAHGEDNTLAYHGFSNRGTVQIVFSECSIGPELPVAPPVMAPVEAPVEEPTADEEVAEDGPVSIGQGVFLVTEGDEDAGTVFVEVTYEGQGWVAFGISPDGTMEGSQVVIGLPDEGTAEKYTIGSGRALSSLTRLPEEQQTLVSSDIKQNDTHTVLTFTKLLEEEGEHPISLTEGNPFVFAVGPENELLSRHPQRGGFTASVGGGAVSGASSGPDQSLWAVHGAFMSIAWGVLAPLAISASLCRDLVPGPPGTWFKIHFFLNSMTITCTIIGFAIAVYAINDQSNGDPGHFKGPPTHRTIGLVIFILAVIQGAIAMFRPHPPAAHPSSKDEEDGQAAEPEEKSTVRFLWEIKHRVLGFAMLGMAWYNVDSGLGLYSDFFGEDDMSTAFWGVVGAICGIALILFAVGKSKSGED